jgi:hypothetical protein
MAQAGRASGEAATYPGSLWHGSGRGLVSPRRVVGKSGGSGPSEPNVREAVTLRLRNHVGLKTNPGRARSPGLGGCLPHAMIALAPQVGLWARRMRRQMARGHLGGGPTSGCQ